MADDATVQPWAIAVLIISIILMCVCCCCICFCVTNTARCCFYSIFGSSRDSREKEPVSEINQDNYYEDTHRPPGSKGNEQHSSQVPMNNGPTGYPVYGTGFPQPPLGQYPQPPPPPPLQQQQQQQQSYQGSMPYPAAL